MELVTTARRPRSGVGRAPSILTGSTGHREFPPTGSRSPAGDHFPKRTHFSRKSFSQLALRIFAMIERGHEIRVDLEKTNPITSRIGPRKTNPIRAAPSRKTNPTRATPFEKNEPNPRVVIARSYAERGNAVWDAPRLAGMAGARRRGASQTARVAKNEPNRPVKSAQTVHSSQPFTVVVPPTIARGTAPRLHYSRPRAPKTQASGLSFAFRGRREPPFSVPMRFRPGRPAGWPDDGLANRVPAMCSWTRRPYDRPPRGSSLSRDRP